MNLFEGFKCLLKHTRPDEGLLYPLMVWSSGSEKNIEMIQNINKKFVTGNRKVFIDELTLNNQCRHIIKYPKVSKDDEKTTFFYKDLAQYFGWTQRELQINLAIIDIEDYKVIIAKAYGYNPKERKILKLPKLELKNAKKRI